MRSLSAFELEVVDKVLKRRGYPELNRGKLSATYRKQGNFTICMVKGIGYGIGAAKRAYQDKPNEELGQQLAFYRAVNDMFPNN